MPKRDSFIKIIQILMFLMVVTIVIDHYLKYTAEAKPQSVAHFEPPIVQTTESALLRKDLQRALSILETCFNTQVSLDRLRSIPVILTAYTAADEECDDTPHHTASAKPVRHGIISISKDLVQEFGLKFGQRVLIRGHGIFAVEDRMNPRMRRRVDIWMDDRQAALLFGKQKGTLFWIGEEIADANRVAKAL